MTPFLLLLLGLWVYFPFAASFCSFSAKCLKFPIGMRGVLRERRQTSLSLTNDDQNRFAVVLLAGGQGKRMKSNIPKQFLPILGKSVFLHSLQIFQSITNVSSIVIVLDKSYRSDYQHIVERDPRIIWADPGKERQDSVYNGLMKVPEECKLVAIHDSARPLVTEREILSCVKDAVQYGAAVLGVPMKSTVKESLDGLLVHRTVPRSTLWEIHTPQIARKQLFLEGFEKVKKENLEVTDDVSVIEAMGLPVKLTMGEYTNIKLTTPEDMRLAEVILMERAQTTQTLSKIAENKVEQEVIAQPIPGKARVARPAATSSTAAVSGKAFSKTSSVSSSALA